MNPRRTPAYRCPGPAIHLRLTRRERHSRQRRDVDRAVRPFRDRARNSLKLCSVAQRAVVEHAQQRLPAEPDLQERVAGRVDRVEATSSREHSLHVRLVKLLVRIVRKRGPGTQIASGPSAGTPRPASATSMVPNGPQSRPRGLSTPLATTLAPGSPGTTRASASVIPTPSETESTSRRRVARRRDASGRGFRRADPGAPRFG